MKKAKQETKKTIYYLSYVRALACVAIVILHTVDAAVILYGDKLSSEARGSALSVVYFMMWAVPCFVMVTGALLLQKNRKVTLKDVFCKYILRVLIALVVFSLLFALFDALMNKDGSGAGFLLTGLTNIVTGNGWAHMWYLYLLIGLYLLLVFYRAVANHISDKEYKYLLLVYFIFLSVLPLFGMVKTSIGFYIHVSTIYPFYLFAGYAIAEKKITIRMPLSVVLILVGVVGLSAAAVVEQANAELIATGNLLTYSSLFIVALSLGVFALIKNLGEGAKPAAITAAAETADVKAENVSEEEIISEVAEVEEAKGSETEEAEVSEEATGTKEEAGPDAEESAEVALKEEEVSVTASKPKKAPGLFGRFLLALDGCSFGIYLIHMIFVRLVLRYLRINPFRSTVAFLVFAGLVIANLLLSWGITWLLKKIPGVRKIL